MLHRDEERWRGRQGVRRGGAYRSAAYRQPAAVALAMEPRGIIAKPEPTGDLTVWLSTQSPHRVRTDLATAIEFPEHRIRVIAPDVGGGFGSKGLLYQEDALASHLALKLGRPVKWISTRSEDFVTTNKGVTRS